MSDGPPETASPVKAALSGRCPRCGRGRLFSGYLKVADRCEACAIEFGGHDAADGPAVLIILFLGFIIAGGAFWLEFTLAPPTWVHMVIWPPLIVVLALAALRPLKAAFIGLQYKYRAVDREFPEE